jgi:type I restriction enzyme, S subunit
MISDLKPYPEYKETGLPWLGQVPVHWDVSPLAGVARLKSVVTQSERQLLSVYLQRGVVRFADVDEKRTNATSEDLSNYQVVDPGDFVLNNQQAWRGSVGVSDYSGIVSPAYLVLALSKRYLARYANLLFRDQNMVCQYLVCSKGVGTIQRNLYWPHLKRVGVIVPPPEEQATIVRFLDYVTHRLDKVIRTKRKTIALLKEQKQAIIHRAVTRGLIPNVPLKDSGIPWLGQIPTHWEVCRVKDQFLCLNPHRIPLSSVERGAMTSHKYDYYGASGVIDKVDDFLFDDELLLIAEDGANLVLRNLPLAIIARGKFWVNNHAHILKPKGCSLEYMAGYMETLNYQPWISGAAQPKLTKDRLLSIAISIAPVTEQSAIVQHFTEQTQPLISTIRMTEREIELLREYRTRLIADVVTGKLDVREAAARCPQEVAPDDINDDNDLGDEIESSDEEAIV